MEAFYNKFISFLNKLLNHKYWYLSTAGVTVSIVLFLTAPSYFPLTKGFTPCDGCADFQEVINRADHLLNPPVYGMATHLANTQLRLTVPLIAKLLGTRSKAIVFVIQQILGFGFLTITCLLSFRLTKDKIISAVITLSICFIYVGKSAFVDTIGFTDAFAFFFLILALYTYNGFLAMVSLILAYFTDERAFIASSLVGTFYLVEFLDLNKLNDNFSSFMKAKLFYVILSWALYFVVRFTLFKLYGLHTPSAGIDMPDLSQLGYILWEGLQGFWLLVVGAVIYLVMTRRFAILSLLTLSSLAMIISTSMIYDLTRSIAYIFPIIFVSLYLIVPTLTKSQLRKVVLISCLISFLSADNFAESYSKPDYYQSLPIKLIEKAFSLKH